MHENIEHIFAVNYSESLWTPLSLLFFYVLIFFLSCCSFFCIFSSSSQLKLCPFFSPPLPICLKRPSMKDTHVPLWIKCVSLLPGRSDVGVYTRWALWFTEGAVVSLCEGWRSGKQECRHPPLFKLSFMSVSHEKHLKLHKYNLTCRLQIWTFYHGIVCCCYRFCQIGYHVVVYMTLSHSNTLDIQKKLMLFLHNETNVLKAPLPITITGKFIFKLFLGQEKHRSAVLSGCSASS